MSDQYLINGLAKKRGELMGEIQELRAQLSQAEEGIASLDRTILMFDPNFEFSGVKVIQKKKAKYFESGELKALFFEILKSNNAPMDSETIIQTIVDKKQLNTENTAEMVKIKMSILNSLKYHCENGLLDREYEGEVQKWSIHIPKQ